MAERRGFEMVKLNLPKNGEVRIYSSVRVRRALEHVTEDMTVFSGVKLLQVLEAVYVQGLKTGREEVKTQLEKLAAGIPKATPGRPKKKRKKKARKKTARKKTARKKKR